MKRKMQYLSLVFLAAIVILPLYWTLVGSFLPKEEFMAHYASASRSPAWFTLRPSVKQYADLLSAQSYTNYPFSHHFLVSILSSSAATVFHLLLAPPLGLYLAKRKNRFAKLLFFFVILALLAPLQVTMTPLFILSKQIGIYNTWWTILLPMSVMPFGIFLMRQIIRVLPDEIIESARLETDSVFIVLCHIVIPISIPAILVLLMISFSELYSMIEQPLILLDSTDHIMPLAIEITNLHHLSKEMVFAASILFVMPCLFLYVLLRKNLLKMIKELTLI